ncbi:MAG: hemerythrin family protein [Desulfovibrionaceae bacterium]|nr:hemerythrin family protein [Desulfovibrionaceae bacterium]MBF0513714.1 hemerythrin family protein [Desulfovibrionaceae bacterium]
METVIWNSDFEVGIKTIDEQHKRLVMLLNSLGKAIEENQGKDAIMGIVEEMKKYSVYHFKTEEDAMTATDYPKLSPHKQEHDAFIEHVLDAVDTLESGGKITPSEVWNFLRTWITKHILETDKAYGPLLIARGIS